MKSADRWQVELNGETSVESIRAIQADAMLSVIELLDKRLTRKELVAAVAEMAAKLMGKKHE